MTALCGPFPPEARKPDRMTASTHRRCGTSLSSALDEAKPNKLSPWG
jgi:hypothetical protein